MYTQASHLMKRLRIAPRFLATIACALALAPATVTVHVLAQQSAARTTDALEAATILYDQGQFDQAQPLFAAIETNSPAYGLHALILTPTPAVLDLQK